MSKEFLVSVIMPAYNAAKYIREAIQSVLDQDYPNFELLIINDGSSDNTRNIIESFGDSRILIFNQENKGVSVARNVGLDHMRGDYFCFLDADDFMTRISLSTRVKKFETNDELSFIDGSVEVMDEELTEIIRIWHPDFQGNPLKDLVNLTGKSFFGPSWMIKSQVLEKIRFEKNLTHCEDLLFYMECAKRGGSYAHVSNLILKHREHEGTVMSDLRALSKSYQLVGKIIRSWKEVSFTSWLRYCLRTRRIIIFSYLTKGYRERSF